MTQTNDRVRLGVSQLVWGYDLSRPDRFMRCLDEAAEIGYQGILAFDSTLPFWYNRPAELKRHFAERGLELAAVIHRPGLDLKGTRRLAAFVAELGAGIMILSGRDGRPEDWDVTVPLLQRHGEIGAEHGLRTLYHHHTGWIAETMEQYERLLGETDRRYLGAMLDCGHATKDFVGHSALEFFEKHHDIIEYVEFKDFSPETDLRTEVGRGACDFWAVAEAIRRHGYRGWVVVEQNGTAGTPLDSSRESYRYITETLGLGKA